MVFLQLIIFILQLMIFLSSTYGQIEFITIIGSAGLTACSFIISIFARQKTYLRNFNLSIIFLFVLMSWIISFQIPIELAFGNTDLLGLRFIDNVEIVNKVVAFSALVLSAFLLGVTLNYSKLRKTLIKVDSYLPKMKYNPKPIFILMAASYLIFVATVNRDYIAGGHGIVKFDGISQSFFGIFLRLSIVYLSIILYNNQDRILSNNNSIKSFFKLFNKLYLFLLLLTVILFLLAHNRVYVILTLTPFLFAFLIYSRLRIKSLTVFITFIGLSVFATLFKLYGIKNIFDNSLEIHTDYMIAKSYFPFTSELGSSIYSQSILYDMWYSTDLLLYGSSYMVGVFRSIPGLMSFLDIDPITYDTAVIATIKSGASYGVGTTSLIDMLINFGPVLTVFLFFIIGFIFSKVESKVFKNNVSVYTFILYLSITAFILFIPRASMNDIVGVIIFNIIFIKLYNLIYLKRYNLRRVVNL